MIRTSVNNNSNNHQEEVSALPAFMAPFMAPHVNVSGIPLLLFIGGNLGLNKSSRKHLFTEWQGGLIKRRQFEKGRPGKWSRTELSLDVQREGLTCGSSRHFHTINTCTALLPEYSIRWRIAGGHPKQLIPTLQPT